METDRLSAWGSHELMLLMVLVVLVVLVVAVVMVVAVTVVTVVASFCRDHFSFLCSVGVSK